jgi:hypothetical protein
VPPQSEGSICTEFLSASGKIHSFEWRVVVCARGESQYDEFADYVVRSRAIVKLVMLNFPNTKDPKVDDTSVLKSQGEGGDGGFLRRMVREMYTSYYDLMVCTQFLENAPQVVTEDDIRDVLIAPLQWIAEATVMFFSTFVMDPLIEKLPDDRHHVKGTLIPVMSEDLRGHLATQLLLLSSLLSINLQSRRFIFSSNTS